MNKPVNKISLSLFLHMVKKDMALKLIFFKTQWFMNILHWKSWYQRELAHFSAI
jgi:hypothetical protein